MFTRPGNSEIPRNHSKGLCLPKLRSAAVSPDFSTGNSSIYGTVFSGILQYTAVYLYENTHVYTYSYMCIQLNCTLIQTLRNCGKFNWHTNIKIVSHIYIYTYKYNIHMPLNMTKQLSVKLPFIRCNTLWCISLRTPPPPKKTVDFLHGICPIGKVKSHQQSKYIPLYHIIPRYPILLYSY